MRPKWLRPLRGATFIAGTRPARSVPKCGAGWTQIHSHRCAARPARPAFWPLMLRQNCALASARCNFLSNSMVLRARARRAYPPDSSAARLSARPPDARICARLFEAKLRSRCCAVHFLCIGCARACRAHLELRSPLCVVHFLCIRCARACRAHLVNCALASAWCTFYASDARAHLGNCALACARCTFYASDACMHGVHCALASARCVFFTRFLPERTIFWKVGISSCTWPIDVAKHDPKLEAKSAPSLLTSHFRYAPA